MLKLYALYKQATKGGCGGRSAIELRQLLDEVLSLGWRLAHCVELDASPGEPLTESVVQVSGYAPTLIFLRIDQAHPPTGDSQLPIAFFSSPPSSA